MSQALQRRDRMLAYRLVVLQFVLCALLVGIAALYDFAAVVAAAVGGLSNAVGNSFYVWVALKPAIAAPATEVVRNFYIGIAGKFLVVMVCLVVAFSVLDSLADNRNAMVLFAAFIAVQSVFWVAPVLE